MDPPRLLELSEKDDDMSHFKYKNDGYSWFTGTAKEIDWNDGESTRHGRFDVCFADLFDTALDYAEDSKGHFGENEARVYEVVFPDWFRPSTMEDVREVISEMDDVELDENEPYEAIDRADVQEALVEAGHYAVSYTDWSRHDYQHPTVRAFLPIHGLEIVEVETV